MYFPDVIDEDYDYLEGEYVSNVIHDVTQYLCEDLIQIMIEYLSSWVILKRSKESTRYIDMCCDLLEISPDISKIIMIYDRIRSIKINCESELEL